MNRLSLYLTNTLIRSFNRPQSSRLTSPLPNAIRTFSTSVSLFAERRIWIDEEDKIVPKISNKDLSMLGGYGGIIDRVADIVRYLLNPKEYTKSGIKAPKGLILSGPPGVGKTFIAEAVAGHAGVPLSP